MAKLAREHRLRERRIDKQARKDARKLAAPDDSAHIGETPEPNEAEHEAGTTEVASP